MEQIKYTQLTLPVLDWTLSDVWNSSIEREERELVVRDYLWASELMQPPCDVWLKMRATKNTNPPNLRSMRKFMAGNIYEYIVGLVLTKAGIHTMAQEECWTRGAMSVKGKGDYICGGVGDYDKAEGDIKRIGLPESIEFMSLTVLKKFKKIYGASPLAMTAIEVKSTSSFLQDRIEATEKPLESHVLQCAHYVIARDLPVGKIIYICRDDCRMYEYVITEADKRLYYERLDYLSSLLKTDTMPSKEPFILLDEVTGLFSKNFGVEYSGYLTMLYDIERPDIYRDMVSGKVSSWNRVLKRIATGAKMTDKNKVIIEDCQKEMGIDMAEQAKKVLITKEEDDE